MKQFLRKNRHCYSPSQQTNAFRMYVKKGWYGLPVVLLLLFVTVMSCNRNALTTQNTEPEPHSAQELLDRKNEAFRDSVKKANAKKYWYLNPENTWLQDRIRSAGGGMIRFNDSIKMKPEELLVTYKEHLGYSTDDAFVEVRRFPMKNPDGMEIRYDRFYKDALVRAENLSINIGTDGYVWGINARFYTDVEKMYQPPLISKAEAKAIMLKAFKEKLSLFETVNLDSIFLIPKGIRFRDFNLQLSPLRNNQFDQYYYEYTYFAVLSSPILETLLYKTYLDPISGEIIKMEPIIKRSILD